MKIKVRTGYCDLTYDAAFIRSTIVGMINMYNSRVIFKTNPINVKILREGMNSKRIEMKKLGIRGITYETYKVNDKDVYLVSDPTYEDKDTVIAYPIASDNSRFGLILFNQIEHRFREVDYENRKREYRMNHQN